MSLTPAPEPVQAAVIQHVIENDVKVTAAEIKELREKAEAVDALADEAAEQIEERDEQIERLKAALKKMKQQVKEADKELPDGSKARAHVARRHEMAMTLNGGSDRQDITRYFEYREMYSEKGREFMDKVVKHTFLVLKENLTPEGDPK